MLATGVGVVLNGLRRSREWLDQTAAAAADATGSTAGESGDERGGLE